MASDLNRCEFIGRLGKDPEMRYSADGNAICNLSLGVNFEYKNKAGEPQKTVTWVRISAYSHLAGICGDYLKKGSQIYISGKWVTRKWVNKDGVDQYTTEVVADQMQMLGSRSADDAPPPPPSRPKPDNSYRAMKEGTVVPLEDLESDVPF
jgi:single-strand DNA-binding protein